MADTNTQYYGMVTDNLGWGVDQITLKQNSDGTYTVIHDTGTMSNAGDHYITSFGYPQAFSTESEALSYIQTSFPSAQKVNSPLYTVKEETVSIGKVSFTNTKQTANEEAISNLCRQVNNSSTSSSQSSNTSSQPALEPVPVESVPKTGNQIQSQSKPKPILAESPNVLEEINREATPVNSSPSSNSSSYNFYFGDGQYTPKLEETPSLRDSLMNPKFDGTEIKNVGKPNINLEVPDIWSSSHKESSTSSNTDPRDQQISDLTKTVKGAQQIINNQADTIKILGQGTDNAIKAKEIAERESDILEQQLDSERHAHQMTQGKLDDTTATVAKTTELLYGTLKSKAEAEAYSDEVERQLDSERHARKMDQDTFASKEAGYQGQIQDQGIIINQAINTIKESEAYSDNLEKQLFDTQNILTDTEAKLANTEESLATAQGYLTDALISKGEADKDWDKAMDKYDSAIRANAMLTEEIDHLETTLKTEQFKNENLTQQNNQLQERLYKVQDYEERIAIEDEATRQTNRALTLRGQNTPITRLIDSGADAQVNLFEVTIYAGQGQTEFSSPDKTELSKNVTFRINTFNAPEKQLQVQDVVYQSGSFPKVMVSSGITRQLDFTIRIDSNYEIYWFMHGIFAGDSSGNFDLGLYDSLNTRYISRITVKALKPNPVLTLSDSDDYYQTTDGYDTIYSWTFFDCILVKIPQIALDMGNSGPVTGVYSFKFGAMLEGLGNKGIMDTIDEKKFFSVQTRDSLLDETRGTP